MCLGRKDNDVTQDPQPTWQDLLDLVARLDASEYETVDVTFGGISVRMSRTGELPGAAPAPSSAPAAPAPAAVPAATSPATSPEAAPSPAPGAAPATEAGPVITAPMLGVFYRRPSPGADPFVQPGDRVEPDTTIGIIEIMKLMNPVAAGVAGVLAAFEAEDGQQVEFGQTLARLEPGS